MSLQFIEHVSRFKLCRCWITLCELGRPRLRVQLVKSGAEEAVVFADYELKR